jgi:hypothetical protein
MFMMVQFKVLDEAPVATHAYNGRRYEHARSKH